MRASLPPYLARCARARRGRRRALLATLLLVSLLQVAAAQVATAVPAFERGGTLFVGATSLARAMGVVATAAGNAFTWRGDEGVVTLFAGSADALTQLPGALDATEWALSAPVVTAGDEWFVPLDALQLLGVALPPDPGALPGWLTLPDGRRLTLEARAPPGAERRQPAGAAAVAPPSRAHWELAEEPLPGVRFFDGAGVSLMLVDLALVPLAAPELTRQVDQVIDAAAGAGSDHLLLLLVTALGEGTWDAELAFEQGGRRLEVGHPYRLLVQQGEAGTVAPDRPVVGAVLLPAVFSLYRPMTIEWGGQAAEITFRR